MARITINGISLDPIAQSQALTAASLVAPDASQSDYILIQTNAPLTDDQKEQLAALGVEIHEYVPDDTYLCAYPATDLAAIRALPFVAWADIYLRGFKIAPMLRSPQGAATASILPPAAGPAHSRALRKVDVVFHDGVDTNADAVKAAVAAAAHLNPDDLQMGRRKVRLSVQERYLDDLAAIDKVQRIEEVPAVQLRNNVAGPIIHDHVVVTGTTYEGDGQIIAQADTGFDKGSTTDVHPAFTGRVAKLYALGRTSPARADDPEGHGTHVAGSALGDGTSATMGGAIRGTAPKAKLVLQSLLDTGGGLGGIPADLNDLFLPPYRDDGARVHTNSWGSTTPGLPYDSSAQEIDDFVWNHQDCVICFAAGNDGIDRDANGVIDAGEIGSESAAKNCITVGASESNRENGETYGALRHSSFPANPIAKDKIADHPDGMAAFSSRGPTKEGRIKPDVVAPGTCILSTRSRKAVSVPTVFGTSSDSAFFFDAGTSMATPLVAGCAAVLRETLVKNGTHTPSAALIKALLINGAVELLGQYSPTEAGLSPNTNSGWGRVDLAGSVIIPGPNPNGGFGDGGPLKQGGESTVVVHVPGRGKHNATDDAATTGISPSLKVTLVWSDPAGAALQNDLDLIVVAANGQERHGNMGTTKRFDRVNNVEQVVWDNIPPGDAKITIRAFRITRFAQPYAYAWRLS
jgi:serine protease AprX